MTPTAPNPAGAAGAAGSGNGSFLGRKLPDSTTRPNPQQKSPAPAEITCASMRAQELRDCLVREILRAEAIAMQAEAALLDADDALALDNLRRFWVALRAGIAPLAAELGRLAGGPRA
jgi:hypothetical protein